MNILDQIIAAKRAEIARLKPLSPLSRFEQKGFFWNIPNRSLKFSLLAEGSTGIIAEFKRKSPSKGWFKKKELEVEPVVVPYSDLGAAGISVLTDLEFFGGDLDDLIQTKVVADVPVLRKDFIIDEWQIAETKAFGGDVILLIAACMKPSEVKHLATVAKGLGLEVLLEIHNEEELDHICDEVDLVGVNNRDLKTFAVDFNRSITLGKYIPADKVKISESGISDPSAIILLKENGFSGFLIGETFMKEENPAFAFAGFVNQLKAKQHED
ncbi:MAG: indole-3-glycerol phosphate synthase TrpC [Chitinophagaceae bacterium]|nr:indole-3-glycerol phosphate synthase TrpC [Chitinophagaceae bacterium]